jgi:hypothetical protein
MKSKKIVKKSKKYTRKCNKYTRKIKGGISFNLFGKSYSNNNECGDNNINTLIQNSSKVTDLNELHKRYHKCCNKILGIKDITTKCRNLDSKFMDIYKNNKTETTNYLSEKPITTECNEYGISKITDLNELNSRYKTCCPKTFFGDNNSKVCKLIKQKKRINQNMNCTKDFVNSIEDTNLLNDTYKFCCPKTLLGYENNVDDVCKLIKSKQSIEKERSSGNNNNNAQGLIKKENDHVDLDNINENSSNVVSTNESISELDNENNNGNNSYQVLSTRDSDYEPQPETNIKSITVNSDDKEENNFKTENIPKITLKTSTNIDNHSPIDIVSDDPSIKSGLKSKSSIWKPSSWFSGGKTKKNNKKSKKSKSKINRKKIPRVSSKKSSNKTK